MLVYLASKNEAASTPIWKGDLPRRFGLTRYMLHMASKTEATALALPLKKKKTKLQRFRFFFLRLRLANVQRLGRAFFSG